MSLCDAIDDALAVAGGDRFARARARRLGAAASAMRAVAYMPESSSRLGFWHAHLDPEVAVARVDFRRDRGERAREGLAGLGLHRHARRHADPQAAGFELRDAGLELHLAQVGDDDDALASPGPTSAPRRSCARRRSRPIGEVSVASRCDFRARRSAASACCERRRRRGRAAAVAERCAVSAASSRWRGSAPFSNRFFARSYSSTALASAGLRLLEPALRDGDRGHGRVDLRVDLARDPASRRSGPSSRGRRCRPARVAACPASSGSPRRGCARETLPEIASEASQIAGADRDDRDRRQFDRDDRAASSRAARPDRCSPQPAAARLRHGRVPTRMSAAC